MVYLVFFFISNVPWILMNGCPTAFLFSAELHKQKKRVKVINSIIAVKQQKWYTRWPFTLINGGREGNIFESRKITAKMRMIWFLFYEKLVKVQSENRCIYQFHTKIVTIILQFLHKLLLISLWLPKALLVSWLLGNFHRQTPEMESLLVLSCSTKEKVLLNQKTP